MRKPNCPAPTDTQCICELDGPSKVVLDALWGPEEDVHWWEEAVQAQHLKEGDIVAKEGIVEFVGETQDGGIVVDYKTSNTYAREQLCVVQKQVIL